MPNPSQPEERRSHAIPIAMIVFSLAALFTGMFDPGSTTAGSRPDAATLAQAQLIRADTAAGFPSPPHADNPPRGPGE